MIGTGWPSPQRNPLPLVPAALCYSAPTSPSPEVATRDAVRLRCRRGELEDCHAWADAHDEDGIWG